MHFKKTKIKITRRRIIKRNFLYKTDFCKGIYCLLKKSKINNTYHFSGNELITIKELVLKICKILNYDYKKLILHTKERKSLDKIYKLNNMKAKRDLGWKIDTPLEIGLKNTISYLYKNYSLIKNEYSWYIHKN